MRGVVKGGNNNGSSKLNIYAQLTEPPKKEGIWIQTSNQYAKVVNDTELYFANAWMTNPSLATAPFSIGNCASIKVGTKIYYIPQTTYALWCYDTVTNVWTQKTKPPYNGADWANCASFGDYIYAFGGYYSSSGLKTGYKYNVVTDTWTQLADIPVTLHHACVEYYNGKVYLLGGTIGNNDSKTVYEYNIATNTWTQKTSGPTDFTWASSCIVGSKIYIHGGKLYSSGSDGTFLSINLCYDAELDSWTTLADMPNYIYDGSSIAMGSNLYVLGHYSRFYKYDILTDIWTVMPNIPSIPTNKNTHVLAHVISTKIYVLSSGVSDFSVYSFNAKPFDANTLVIFKSSLGSGAYYTELVTPSKPIQGSVFTRLTIGFNNAWLYYNGNLQEYPTYYGDGTKWVKFKN